LACEFDLNILRWFSMQLDEPHDCLVALLRFLQRQNSNVRIVYLNHGKTPPESTGVLFCFKADERRA